MKCLLLVWVMILCLVPLGGWAEEETTPALYPIRENGLWGYMNRAGEVVIEPPHYVEDNAALLRINNKVRAYSAKHNLKSPPNIIKVFFKYEEDHEIEEINKELEQVIRDLSNTRDKQVLHLINQYPVLMLKAHTRPFDKRWLNILAAVIVPAGIFFYFRMWRFRLRLLHDLKVIRYTDTNIVNYTEKRIDRLTKEAE